MRVVEAKKLLPANSEKIVGVRRTSEGVVFLTAGTRMLVIDTTVTISSR